MILLVNKETNVRRLSDAIKANLSEKLEITSKGHLADSQKIKAIAAVTTQQTKPLCFLSVDKKVIGKKDSREITIRSTTLFFQDVIPKPKKQYRLLAVMTDDQFKKTVNNLSTDEPILLTAMGSRAVSIAEDVIMKTGRKATVKFIEVIGENDNMPVKALEFVTWK